eukprot:CAMPEP_0171199550 /NCGR_PEP_ID=MMETSP0790-20130122/23521_1 /TAXON_ID=2925 /ORGANISM="Alexandrium catenella, Strain OF101" /LENGTH=73 /DNA_ID=CAMNT_0011664899 /DNA_START=41 /DNA_END=260 /DNA_ORIENTATION=-
MPSSRIRGDAEERQISPAPWPVTPPQRSVLLRVEVVDLDAEVLLELATPLKAAADVLVERALVEAVVVVAPER